VPIGRGLLERFDRFQQEHRATAIPVAIARRYSTDRCSSFAAMLAYHGFLSILPLFLVLVSVTRIVLNGHPALRDRVVAAIVEQFGALGAQLQAANIKPATGDAIAIAVGLGVALWAGLGVMQSAQVAFNTIWGVPRDQQPDFMRSRMRSLITIVGFGILLIGSAVLPGVLALVGFAFVSRILGLIASYAVALALFLVVYRTLTRLGVGWRDVFAGAAVAAAAWVGLQTLGAWLIARSVIRASELYGFFGVTVGMLVWISLGAQITLYGAEINVVMKLRLWPVSILRRSETDA
jgi:YihY family inner membrane protein